MVRGDRPAVKNERVGFVKYLFGNKEERSFNTPCLAGTPKNVRGIRIVHVLLSGQYSNLGWLGRAASCFSAFFPQQLASLSCGARNYLLLAEPSTQSGSHIRESPV